MSHGRQVHAATQSPLRRRAVVGLTVAGILALAMVAQATSASAVGPGTVLLGTDASYLGAGRIGCHQYRPVDPERRPRRQSRFSGFGVPARPRSAAPSIRTMPPQLRPRWTSSPPITMRLAHPAATPSPRPIAGGTLIPGVYTASSGLAVSGNVTLDGQGDNNAVFIFQAGSSLTTASATHILLTGGAQACNVYWQVSTSATRRHQLDLRRHDPGARRRSR